MVKSLRGCASSFLSVVKRLRRTKASSPLTTVINLQADNLHAQLSQNKAVESPPLTRFFYFFSLPPELRLEIYRQVFKQPDAIDDETGKVSDAHGTRCQRPALLRTCRQIKDEALPVLYTTTTTLIAPFCSRLEMLAYTHRHIFENAYEALIDKYEFSPYVVFAKIEQLPNLKYVDCWDHWESHNDMCTRAYRFGPLLAIGRWAEVEGIGTEGIYHRGNNGYEYTLRELTR